MRQFQKKIMWQYYVMLGLGLVLLFAGISSFRNTLAFLKRGVKVTATVTQLRLVHSEEDVYAPTFSYRTTDDRLFTYELPEGNNPPFWKIGETETIIYEPNDPSKARLYSYFRIFSWSLVLTSLALPLLTVGGGYFIAERLLK